MGIILNPLTGQLDFTGGSDLGIGSTITGSTPDAILVVDPSGNLGEVGPLTNGQLLIGSTGAPAVAAALTGTTNQVIVTPGAGSVTLSLPQDIAITSSPTFEALKTSSLVSVNIADRALLTSAGVSVVTWETQYLNGSEGNSSINWDARLMSDVNGSDSVFYSDRTLVDTNGTATVNWDTRQLNDTSGTLALSWSSTGVDINGTLYTNVVDTSAAGTLAIGTLNATSINIGNASSTVNIHGTVVTETATTLNVTNPVFTVNSGGATGSASNSGMQVMENNIITGYNETSADRNSWIFKAPNTAGVATITPGASGITLNQSSHDPVTLNVVGSTPNADGVSISGQSITLQPASSSFPGVVTISAQTFAGDKTFTGDILASSTNARSIGSYDTLFAGAHVNLLYGYNSSYPTGGGPATVDLSGRTLSYKTGVTSVNWESGILSATGGATVVDWGTSQLLRDTTGVLSVSWANRTLTSAANATAFDWSSTFNDNKSRLLSNVTDPVSAQDAATKNYVDIQVDVQVNATNKSTNTPLTGAIPLTIDAQTVTSSMKVLLAAQTTGTQNGVYTYSDNGSTYTLTLYSGFTNTVGKRVFQVPATGSVWGGTSFIISQIISGTATFAVNGFQTSSVPATLTPNGTTGARNLGSAANPWGNSFTNAINVTNSNASVGGLSADATTLYLTGSTRGVTVFSGNVGSPVGMITWPATGSSNSGVINIGTGSVVDGISANVNISTGTASGTGSRGSVVINANNLNMGASKIVSLGDPTSAQDAATKHYVDIFRSAGDISETSFALVNNQSSAANVTGFAFNSASTQSFEALVHAFINATSTLVEQFTIKGVFTATGWKTAVDSIGDTSGITFSITSGGQIQYTSNSYAGFTSATLKFRAITTSP